MNFDFTELINELILEHVMFLPGCRKVGNNYNFRCIYCHDSKKSTVKKRGWVYTNHIQGHSYYCFNCGASGGGINLAADVMNVDVSEVHSIVAGMLKRENYEDTFAKDLSNEIEPLKIETVPDFEIPINWVDLNSDCEKLIEGRQILNAPFKPDNMKFYYCKTSKRLVIPWYDYNDISTYQTRAIYNNQYPKYSFQSGANKGLFGMSGIDISIPYIFTHEGVFDSIFVINSLAVGSISPNRNQRDILEETYPTHDIVYFTDNPWLDESSKKFLIELADKSPNQLIYLWDKSNKFKDINDEVIATDDIYKYSKIENLKSNIFPASVVKLCLLFNKMP